MNNLNTRAITTTLILTTIAVWVGWDVFAYFHPNPDDTESRIILETVTAHPWLSFSFGVLVGHLVWPKENKFQYTHMFVAWGVTGAVTSVGIWTSLLQSVPLIVLFLLGLLTGHFLWGQESISK